MGRALTPQQLKVLEAIDHFASKFGYAPFRRDVAELVKSPQSSVNSVISRLMKVGRITTHPNRGLRTVSRVGLEDGPAIVLARKVREAGIEALGRFEVDLDQVRFIADLDGGDSPQVSGIYARALIAMFDALPNTDDAAGHDS